MSDAFVLLPYPPSAPGVYRIVDVETGRFYIGSSINIAKRWRYHCYRLDRGDHPNPILQALWTTNHDRLRIEVIELCSAEKKDVLRKEQDVLDASGVGVNRMCMNVLPVAGSPLGVKRSEKTRRALSAAITGKRHTVEAKAKMRAAKLGRPLSAEHRRKLGDAARGKKINRPTGIYMHTLRLLSPEQVRELRVMRANGASWTQLAAVACISLHACRRAVIGKTYRDVR